MRARMESNSPDPCAEGAYDVARRVASSVLGLRIAESKTNAVDLYRRKSLTNAPSRRASGVADREKIENPQAIWKTLARAKAHDSVCLK